MAHTEYKIANICISIQKNMNRFGGGIFPKFEISSDNIDTVSKSLELVSRPILWMLSVMIARVSNYEVYAF